MSTIFISHRSADNAEADELKTWLASQGHTQLFLDFDPMDGIPAGVDWEQRLYRELRRCEALLVVLTPAWLQSKWCSNELAIAREKGKAIFVVRIKPCAGDRPIPSLQEVDLTSDREAGLSQLARGLKEHGLDPAGAFDWNPNRPIYPGLASYDIEDAAIFFGRADESVAAAEALRRLQLQPVGAPKLLLITGASGSGKSSLMRAGILARLRNDPAGWIVTPPFRRAEDCVFELARSLTFAYPRDRRPAAIDDVVKRLRDVDVHHQLRAMARDLQLAWNRPHATVLLAMDQAEEFLATDTQAAHGFLDLLRNSLAGSARDLLLVATIRSDRLGAWQQHKSVKAAAGRSEFSFEAFPLGPMPMDRLSAIVRRPAEHEGLIVDDDLMDALQKDTSTPDALPLLAYTLRRLHELHGGDRRLTLRGYQSIGKLEGSVRTQAEATIDATRLDPTILQALRDAFVPGLVQATEDGSVIKAPARLAALPRAAQPVLRRLCDEARLLVIDRDREGQETIEIAHEALLRVWPLLQSWIKEDIAQLQQFSAFKRAASEWRSGEDHPDLIVHRRERLREVEVLVDQRRFASKVDDLLLDYLRACRQAQIESDERERQIKERELRDAMELARRSKNQVRSALGASVVLFLLVLVALAQWWQAGVARDQATAAFDRSLSVSLSAQSRSLLGTHDERALLLAVEAVNATRHDGGLATQSARAALQQALSRVTGVALGGHSDFVSAAAFSDDERTLATASSDGEIRVWDISDPDKPKVRSILRLPQVPKAILFDRAGENVVALSWTGSSRFPAHVWSLRGDKRHPPSRLLLGGEPADDIAMSRENIAVAGISGRIVLLARSDFAREEVIRTLSSVGHSGFDKVAFSSDGQILLAGTRSSHVLIWDLRNPDPNPVDVMFADHRRQQPYPDKVGVDLLGISDDRSALFTGSSDWFDSSTNADLDLKLWKLKELKHGGGSLRLPHRDVRNSSAIKFAQFSRDGRSILTESYDGRVRSFSSSAAAGSETSRAASKTFYVGGFTQSAEISPEGTALALTVGNEVRVLRLDGSLDTPIVLPLLGFDGTVVFARFSPKGRFLVAAGPGGTARLWDLSRADPTAPVVTTQLSPYAPAHGTMLSADGKVAVLLKPNAIEFWRLHDPIAPELTHSVHLDAARFEQLSECLFCTVSLAPDNRWTAIQTAQAGRTEIVELAAPHRSFEVNGQSDNVEFGGDGRWLFVSPDSESEMLFDLSRTGLEIAAGTPVTLPKEIHARSLSPDGRYVVYHRYLSKQQDGSGHDRTDGLLASVAAVNKSVARVDLQGFSAGISNVTFSNDGQWVALTGQHNFIIRSQDDTLVKLIRLNDPHHSSFDLHGQEFAGSALFSGDSRWLLTASGDILLRGSVTQARLWALKQDGQAPTARVLPNVTTYLHAAQFSPDGRFLVTINGAGPTARLWKLADEPSLVTTLAVPRENWHFKIVFSADSKTLVISGDDSTTPYLWRIDRPLVPSRGLPIPNGEREIQSIEFTPDGSQLVIFNSDETSGSEGSHVTLVQVDSFPAEGSTYTAADFTEAMSNVIYRRDLGLLLVAGRSIQGRWIGIESLLHRAEQAAGRNLSLDEWIKAEIPKPYRATFSRLPVDDRTLEALPSVIARLHADSADEAEELTKNVIDWTHDLDEPEMCNTVAWEFAKQRNGSAALASVSCALRQLPENDQYRDTRGVALALLGRSQEAIADLEFYVRARQDDPQQSIGVAKRQRWIRALRDGRDPFTQGID